VTLGDILIGRMGFPKRIGSGGGNISFAMALKLQHIDHIFLIVYRTQISLSAIPQRCYKQKHPPQQEETLKMLEMPSLVSKSCYLSCIIDRRLTNALIFTNTWQQMEDLEDWQFQRRHWSGHKECRAKSQTWRMPYSAVSTNYHAGENRSE